MTSTYSCKYFTVQFPQEYVAHVEINRPEKMNAFLEPMWMEMGRLFDKLSHDSAVRAIVLTGAGETAFTAGMDVKAQSEGILGSDNNADLDVARKAVHLRRFLVPFQECITAVERCEKPVIVAMHGFTLGLGIDLSTACDIRMCARETKFSVKEVDIGAAADIGTLSRLPRVVGNIGWVKEVALTSRLFGPEEALKVGFVNTVYENKAAAVKAAIKLAALMATKSPVAVQGTKDILNWSRDHSVQDGLRYTSVWNSAALQTQDVTSALMSGVQKRKPTFEKL